MNTLSPLGFIRTFVPIIIGALCAWLAREYNVIIDEGTSQELVNTFTAALTAVYYAVFRVLEAKFPAFGWFLGAPTPPVYETPVIAGDYTLADGVVAVDTNEPLVPLSYAEQMAEDAATEAYRQIEVGGDE